MRKTKRFAAALLTALMLLSVSGVGLPAVWADEREELQSELDEINRRKDELQDKIDAVKEDKDAALQTKLLLDQRNSVLEEQIRTVNKQIANTTEAIAEYEQKEQEQYELFCRQTRQEEERGHISYWSVLFKATGFADLLSRIDFINEVMEYNQRVIADLRAVREQLDQSRRELEEQKADLSATQQELESQIAEADRIINEFISTEKGLEAMLKEEEEEFDRVTEELENYHEETGDLSTGEDDPGTGSVLDGLIWPSKARYITSPFGNRNTGIPGASTDHQGVDIGASYGSSVFAAQSGKVIQAGWNGGYGYCITISHGDGVTTLYAHLSDYDVRVGSQVVRGQVIGKCGSTGISSGPHIHYEIRVNGRAIDPLPYLPGYTRWW